MALINTGFKLATAVTSTNTGSTAWIDPNNLLLVDDQFATSSGPTQTVTLGNFNHNIPVGSSILNITLRVRGYRGSFNTTLNLFAVDDTSGVQFSYPYAPPFQGFSGINTTYTLASTLFATTWTVDAVNNIKLTLIADGELHLDSAEIDVLYDDNVVGPVIPPISGEVVCSEFVQAQPFSLARAMTSADLFCFTTSFNYPSSTGTGAPIVIGDFYGDAMITIDQGKPKEENCQIVTIEHDYQGTGLVRLGFGSLANRGLNFKFPYTSDVTKIYPHTGTAELVISNSAPFYNRFLKKCQIDALVSAPIEVLDEGVTLTTAAHSFDFTGGGVTATVIGQDVTVNIPGAGVTPPVVVSTSSSTNFNVQTPTLTWVHTSSGLNRLLLVQVSTEEVQTITSITFNGVPLTQEVSNTDVVNNLRSETWSLVAPPVGTFNIVVTVSAPAFMSAGAESYVTVDQVTPIGTTQTASGNSNTPTLVIVTANDNSLVVDSLTTAMTPIVYTVGPGQTLNWRHTANNVTRQGGSSVEGAGMAPDAVTLNYAITQITDWVMSAVEVNGILATLATLAVLDEGIPVDSSVAFMDFVGSGVVATQTVPGSVQVTISGSTSNLATTVNQVAHGLVLGDIIKSNGTDNEFTLAQADVAANSEAVGIVTNVIDVNNFEYVSAAVQLSGAYVPVGVPGTSVWLDPAVVGGMTTTEPSTVGEIKRGLGTIIASGATMYFDIAALAEEIVAPGGSISIGGIVMGGTDGSVLFINPAGILAEDNANFFYDNINNFFGLGTNTPAFTLDVVGDANITGKLTVGGAIDPTSLTLADVGNAAYIEFSQGTSAAVSPASTGRIRYNATLNTFQISENGGAYADLSTGGSVTSIDVSGGTTGLTTSGGPITTSGTITIAGTVNETHGGTNQITYATGDILYASGINTLSKLTATTNGFILTLAGGVPVWSAAGAGGITQLTGDVTAGPGSGSQVAIIANDSVTFAKFQNITTNRLLGRATAGSGDMEEITLGTNLSFTGTTLNAAGGGGGTVTSVDVSGGTTGLVFTGGPIVASGTITMSGTLGVVNGGTGSTSFTAGSVVFSNGTILTQDNANFFWDDTNNRLGLGITTPNQQLEITANFRLPTSTSTTGVIYSGASTYIHNVGTNNFFAGVSAGNLTNTGQRNVGVGQLALNALTTGDGNVAVGRNSNVLNTTGSNNISIGNATLFTNVSGIQNTAIGGSSLFLSTGDFNTVLGSLAGDEITSGSNNLVLGYQMDVPTPTGSDQMSIGNLIYGTGINGSGVSTISTGSIGIGVQVPLAKLHVVQPTLGNAVQQLTSTATNDDPAEIVTQGRVATTDATVTTIQTIAIPASTTVAIESIVIARRTGGASGTAEDGARYKISAVYKNVAGTATIIGAITRTIDEDVAAYNSTFAISGGNVIITVAGPATTNVTWHSTTRTYSVSS